MILLSNSATLGLLIPVFQPLQRVGPIACMERLGFRTKNRIAKWYPVRRYYYYWPEVWMQNRPGMFTGSGMPMRFADIDGSLIDVYWLARHK